jgi:tetratricopeptide (TPR) repeat protein
MQVYSDRGMTDLALQAGRKAVELNPNNSDVLADFGCRLIYQTQYAEGMGYVKQSYQLNSERPPIWQEFCLFVAFHNTNQLADSKLVFCH